MKKLAELDVRFETLPNGLLVATVQKPINTMSVSVAVNVGARFENVEENGLSHFLEHMAFKGTETRNTHEIAVEVETLGADINAFTSRSMTVYHITGLGSHVSKSMEILADVLRNSTLPQDEIDREKEVVVQEIHQSQDDIHDVAMNAFTATAYPDQALGRSILGSEENVRSFSQEAIRSYMNKHYHAGNMMVIGVGDVDHDEFVELARQRFGNMENHGESTHPVAAYKGGSILVEDNRYDQAHIFVGFPAPAPNDETYPPFKILSDVLGSGMSSPLFQEVREKRGMVYSIYSTMYRHIDHSLMIISGSTTPNHIEDCIRVSCQELVKVANGQIQDHDWERARNQIFMQLAQRADKVSGIAPAIASEMFTLKRLTTIQEMYDRYSTVTKEQVIAAAKTLLASAPTVTVAGNVGEGILTADPLDIVKNTFATA